MKTIFVKSNWCNHESSVRGAAGVIWSFTRLPLSLAAFNMGSTDVNKYGSGFRSGRTIEIVPPKRANLVTPTNIPNCDSLAFSFNIFDVKPDSWYDIYKIS